MGFGNLGAQGLWRSPYTRGGKTCSLSMARAVSHIILGCVPPFQSMPNQMRGRQRDPAALEMQLRGVVTAPGTVGVKDGPSRLDLDQQPSGLAEDVSLPWLEEKPWSKRKASTLSCAAQWCWVRVTQTPQNDRKWKFVSSFPPRDVTEPLSALKAPQNTKPEGDAENQDSSFCLSPSQPSEIGYLNVASPGDTTAPTASLLQDESRSLGSENF